MAHVGGQALIEGVMMQYKERIALAARKDDGKIVTKVILRKSITKRKPWSFPVIRGAITLGETLGVGVKALNWSASVNAGGKEEKLPKWQAALSIALATGFALVLFKLLPLGIAQLVGKISAFSGRLAFNAVEGISKIGILAGYIYSIGFMKDVKRIFMYHGAEHKAVNCHEAGEKLTPANVMKYSTANARCGTSFILLVIFISILVYIFLPMSASFLVKYALRLALLPVIAGIAYEALKSSARHQENIFVRALVKPGMLLQSLTTREPGKRQVEVAIAALKKCLGNR